MQGAHLLCSVSLGSAGSMSEYPKALEGEPSQDDCTWRLEGVLAGWGLGTSSLSHSYIRSIKTEAVLIVLAFQCVPRGLPFW